MPIGIIKKLIHLSQATYAPNTRLVPSHNDKGYGIIADEAGREVYFPHDMVAGLHGFDDLRRGQQLEYTLENAPYLRTATVKVVTHIREREQRRAA